MIQANAPGETCRSPNLPVLAKETPIPMFLGPEVPDRCEALEMARCTRCSHGRLVTHCPPCPQSPTWQPDEELTGRGAGSDCGLEDRA